MYHLYIIYSNYLDAYYIGYTGDQLKERLRRHNSQHKGFTGKTDDWQIVYTEGYSYKKEAYARERQLKSWKSKKRIQSLIERNS